MQETTGTRSIDYRDAGPHDRDALVALGRSSFAAAFGHLYAAADLAAFLRDAHAPERVAAQLADPLVHYRLAESGGALAGYCKLVAAAQFGSHSDARRPAVLSQLYTDPALTGQGIGSTLIDWALATARTLDADAVQLSVWSGNEAAQRFYARHGFVKIADIDFWVGSHRDDEFLFERRF